MDIYIEVLSPDYCVRVVFVFRCNARALLLVVYNIYTVGSVNEVGYCMQQPKYYLGYLYLQREHKNIQRLVGSCANVFSLGSIKNYALCSPRILTPKRQLAPVRRHAPVLILQKQSILSFE